MRTSAVSPSAFLVFVTSHIALSATSLAAEKNYDWPHYLGPNHNGISQETGLQFKDLKQLWNRNVNTGFASIAVVDKRAYTMGNKDDTDIVYCLDVESGESLWKYSYSCALQPNMYEGGPNATPTVHRKKVYTLSKAGHIFCLDAITGKRLWSHETVDDFGATPHSWGFAGSPTIVGSMVVFNVGESGLALDKDSGKTIWSSRGGNAGYASALPATLNGKTQICMFTAKHLLGLNPADGKELWSHRWQNQYGVNAATPIVFDDRVFISSGYNAGCTLLDLSSGKPQVQWRNKVIQNHFNSSVKWQGHIYGIDGHTGNRVRLVCVNAATGETAWQQKDYKFGSLILADKTLVILSEIGELITVKTQPDRYYELSRRQVLNGKCWTVPTLCNARLYTRNATGNLICWDVRDVGKAAD